MNWSKLWRSTIKFKLNVIVGNVHKILSDVSQTQQPVMKWQRDKQKQKIFNSYVNTMLMLGNRNDKYSTIVLFFKTIQY